MKHHHLIAATLLIAGCSAPELPTGYASFESYSYASCDPRFDAQLNPGQYYNPILSGTYPDPSICRKGDDYYMVNSSFVYYPGIPLWHSRDLVNWELMSYVLNRPEQLTFPARMAISNGIYAPDIVYNEHNDTFYMITTGVGNMGNFVVKTKDPAKGWSDPISLPAVNGIDPSLCFDNDGRAYIVHNGEAPDMKAEYDGHRTIRILEYDVNTDQTISESKIIVDKGTFPERNPIWIEGPHLYHVGDTYYLMCAEGGTEFNHSEVVFRADNPFGPYEQCAINPILTQRNLDPSRPFPITSTGHADLVQTPEGDWWAIFLGVCTYDGDQYGNIGRSTFLLPVSWEQGQPVILADGLAVPTVNDAPALTPAPVKGGLPTTGNYSYSDDFDDAEPGLHWMTLRGPRDPEKIWIADGKLSMIKDSTALNSMSQGSMICQWIRHASYSTSTSVDFAATAENDMAGLAIYLGERAYFALGKTMNAEGQPAVELIRRQGMQQETIASIALDEKTASRSLKLKVDVSGAEYQFSYSIDGKKWKPIGDTQDGTFLSVLVGGGFTGTAAVLFCTSTKQGEVFRFPRRRPE